VHEWPESSHVVDRFSASGESSAIVTRPDNTAWEFAETCAEFSSYSSPRQPGERLARELLYEISHKATSLWSYTRTGSDDAPAWNPVHMANAVHVDRVLEG